MDKYYPHRWVVTRITTQDGARIHKVFGTWYGAYLGREEWRLNSGIVKCVFNSASKNYEFHGHSGSVYYCEEDTYGTSGWSAGILENLIFEAADQGYILEVLDENTDWVTNDYAS